MDDTTDTDDMTNSNDATNADDATFVNDTTDVDESDERVFGDLERYRAINYLDDDETVTIIQERENDDAWIQSDLTFEVRT